MSDDEQRILCLSSTIYSWNKQYCGKAGDSPIATKPDELLECYGQIGNYFNFKTFWANWQEYLTEIAYLTQAKLYKPGKKSSLAKNIPLKIPENRLHQILRPLLAFGTIAAQLTDPTDLSTKTEGNSLKELLQILGIRRKLIYHRSRNCTGLLSQSIHNGVAQFVQALDWQPILLFAQGVVYLAPEDSELPDRAELQKFLWGQISDRLSDSMLQGNVGFKRDGKGLKAAPQTLELFSPAQLIRKLPQVIQFYVKNEEDPATPRANAHII